MNQLLYSGANLGAATTAIEGMVRMSDGGLKSARSKKGKENDLLETAPMTMGEGKSDVS